MDSSSSAAINKDAEEKKEMRTGRGKKRSQAETRMK